MSEDKVRIKINIAGESIGLFVPYSRQETTRLTEEKVNELFAAWRNQFPKKSDRELLAMIAFRFADLYDGLLRERDEAREAAEALEVRMEALLAEKV